MDSSSDVTEQGLSFILEGMIKQGKIFPLDHKTTGAEASIRKNGFTYCVKICLPKEANIQNILSYYIWKEDSS